MIIKYRTLPLLSLLLLAAISLTANAAPPSHWVGTWAASPVPAANAGPYGATDSTYREIVHVSLGGSRLRVILTNEFGTEPLTIGAAHVALSSGGGAIDSSASAPLTFGGKASITIPAGALAISDPADLKLPTFANLAVSLFIRAQTIEHVSLHTFADQTSYQAPGNAVSAATLTKPAEITNWPFLKGVDVFADGDAASIVAFGDSITDGALSTLNANARWPNILATRLQADPKTAHLGVLNQGIGGNRILHDGSGPSALARFDRDVLAQAGVKYLVILEGINDIGHAADPGVPYDFITADDLIQAYGQMIARAHTHGIKVFGATLTPYVGAKYASPKGEAIRAALNQWIRTTKDLDGVIDFEKVTRDSSNPPVYAPVVDSPDHLHPRDAGYKLMGESIDLSLFTK